MIEISLQAEKIFSLLGVNITNTFLTSILVSFLLILLSLLFYFNKRNNFVFKFLYIILSFIYKIVKNVLINKYLIDLIFPLIATLFLFILTANIMELIPGFLGAIKIYKIDKYHPLLRSPSSDITMTLALALISVFFIQYKTLIVLGIKKYFKFLKFFISFIVQLLKLFWVIILSFLKSIFVSIFDTIRYMLSFNLGVLVLLYIPFFVLYYANKRLLINDLTEHTHLGYYFINVLLILLAIYTYMKMMLNKSYWGGVNRILLFVYNFKNYFKKNKNYDDIIFPISVTFVIFFLILNVAFFVKYLLIFYHLNMIRGFDVIIGAINDLLSVDIFLVSIITIILYIFVKYMIKNISRFFVYINFDFYVIIKLFLGIFEIFSNIVKVLSFSFRLFGNVFGGTSILLIILFLYPYVVPIPFLVLEFFIGILQAFIFSVLTLMFFKVSIQEENIIIYY